MTEHEKSVRALFSDLIDSINRLIGQEIRLAQSEGSEKVSEAATGIMRLGAGLMIAVVALLVLVEALVVALANFMPPAMAALLVGVALALIAFLLIHQGQSALRPRSLALPRTMESMRDDKDLVMERTR